MPSTASFLRRLSLQGLRKKSPKPEAQQHQQHEVQEVREELPLPVAPETQTVLLLHAAKQPYQLTENYPVPQLEGEHDVLVRTQAIGLNPIDWKAP